ncbi:MaoC family dehydratase [Actinophytocola sp.]|uniref:MaoC family dehydratase n=1 Tax=Actinophytocola sp. TaxID=1872138 RepID=UPI003D6C3881
MTIRFRRGRYAAELEAGDVFHHCPGRTFHAAENTLYCGLTFNSNSLHLDGHAAAATEFGRPLMNALFVFSHVVGLSVSEISEGTAIANLEFSQVTFPAPVFDGDTVYASTRVIEVRPTRGRPNAAVVTLEHIGTNQEGVVVCSGRRVGLMHHQPEEVVG